MSRRMALNGHPDETHLMSALRGKAEVLPLAQSGSVSVHKSFSPNSGFDHDEQQNASRAAR
jgi:hypothetical protein